MSNQDAYNALCNMAQSTGLPITVHTDYQQDKRRAVPRYHITIDGVSVGPVLDYHTMNHMLLGMVFANRHR